MFKNKFHVFCVTGFPVIAVFSYLIHSDAAWVIIAQILLIVVALFVGYCTIPELFALDEEETISIDYTRKPVGDRRGEYLFIKSGKYEASMHVAVAFMVQALALGYMLYYYLNSIHIINLDNGYGVTDAVLILTCYFAGLATTSVIFYDRWYCIENFSSKFCSGYSNLSILYVPIVAIIYANMRGIMKLFNR